MSGLNTDKITAFVDIAKQAGHIALRDFKLGKPTLASVTYKNGGSPVTSADIAVDTYLKKACSEAFGDYGWFSEETVDTPHRLQKHQLIIADPIDGTRAYAAGNPHWCVSLAMIENGRPVLGCLYAPALEELYIASIGGGATLNGACLKLSSSSFKTENYKNAPVFGPKPMVDWLNTSLGLTLKMQPKVPSLALRLARIAVESDALGLEKLGLASENAHDWDIAAADIILCEAGGQLLDFKGQKPVYNKPKPTHPPLFAASNLFADYILDKSLNAGYEAMTADEAREKAASAWTNGLINDFS